MVNTLPAFSQVAKKLGAVKPMRTTISDCLRLGRYHQMTSSISSPSLCFIHTHTCKHISFHHSPGLLLSPCLSTLSTPLALRCVCRQTVPKWLLLSPLVSVVWLVPPSLLDSTLGAKKGHRQRKVCVCVCRV